MKILLENYRLFNVVIKSFTFCGTTYYEKVDNHCLYINAYLIFLSTLFIITIL